jgi:hypothetical protein
MKKQLFIIISLLLFAANTNAANGYNNALHEVNNLAFGLQSSAYSNNGILDGSTELSRIGRALVHKGHKKFWNHPATQNGITALTWLAPIGEGITFLSNIIRTGAKLITKQAVKEGAKLTKSQIKSISSLQKQIAKHEIKVAEYIKDPMKFDNKGFLKNASDELRQNIIQSRIKNLNKEIQKFKNEIQKILNKK